MAQTTAPRMTPLARLLDTITAPDGGLANYLAVRRIPGRTWQSFDEIAEDLTDRLGHPVNRVSVKTFADGFGIPNTRYVAKRAMPGPVTAEQIAEYADTVAPFAPGIRDHIASMIETDAILTDPDTMAAIADGEAEVDDECHARGCDIREGDPECRRCGAETVVVTD